MSKDSVRPKKILVFLPQAAAQVIVTRLAGRGHESVAVSTVPEVFDALRSDSYAFAITTRQEIDLLRNIRSIPVVNLEIFFHPGPSGDAPLVTSKRFDGKAFMERIEFLVRAVSAKPEYAGVEQVRPSGMRDRKVSRWWTMAKDMVGLARRREGLRNAQS